MENAVKTSSSDNSFFMLCLTCINMVSANSLLNLDHKLEVEKQCV